MGENAPDIEALLHSTEVGGTIRMRIEKSQLNAKVPDRVSLIMNPPATPNGRATLQSFTKDASGMWDLESVTGARNSSIIEVVLRRAASDI